MCGMQKVIGQRYCFKTVTKQQHFCRFFTLLTNYFLRVFATKSDNFILYTLVKHGKQNLVKFFLSWLVIIVILWAFKKIRLKLSIILLLSENHTPDCEMKFANVSGKFQPNLKKIIDWNKVLGHIGWWKNPTSKISCYSPFNAGYFANALKLFCLIEGFLENQTEPTQTLNKHLPTLKGQSHEIFCTRFFPPNNSSWSH